MQISGSKCPRGRGHAHPLDGGKGGVKLPRSVSSLGKAAILTRGSTRSAIIAERVRRSKSTGGVLLAVKEEGEGGGKSAAMAGPLLGVIGEWRARRCLRGWVVEVKVVAVWWSCSGALLVVGVVFGPK